MSTRLYSRSAGPARWTVVAILMVVLTLAHAWPLSRHLSTHLIATADIATGSWSLTGMATQLTRDPMALFDGNNLYPANRTLAVVDHQATNAALAAPMLAAGAGQVLTFNLSLLLGFLLSALFMCLLVERLSGSLIGGVVAGCAFAWSAYRVVEIGHPHMMVTQWIPLALLALHRFMARPDLRRAGALTVASLLVALSSLHIAQLGGLTIGLVAFFLLVAATQDRGRRLAGLAVAGGVSLLVLLPIARIYLEVASRWPPATGNGRETLGSLVGMSLRAVDLLALPVQSTAPYAALLPRPENVGAFPGLVTLVLAGSLVVGLRSGARGRRPMIVRALWAVVVASALLVLLAGGIAAIRGDDHPIIDLARITSPVAMGGIALMVLMLAIARRAGTEPATRRATERVTVVAYASLAVIGALMALGPRVLVAGIDIGTGLTRYDLLPIPLIIRAPWRFTLLMVVGLSVLAGLGTARLVRHRGRTGRVLLTLLLLLALNAELGSAMPELIEVPPPTAVDRWLRDEGKPGAVVEYPLQGRWWWAIHRSYYYDRRVVNGAGYLLPGTLRQLESLPDLSPDQLELLLRHFRPRYVVVRSGLYSEGEWPAVAAAATRAGGSLRRRFRGDGEVVYELFDRARAPAIVREWPGHQLRSSSGVVAFESRVTDGPDDVVPELTVLFNGQELLRGSGAEVTRWTERSVSIQAQQIVDRRNRLEFRAGYRFGGGRAPLVIGETHVEIPADVWIEADLGRSLIQVNGRRFFGRLGYLIVALDPVTAEVVAEGRFDTHGAAADADRMAEFLEQLSPGTVVLVATRNDAGRWLHDKAVEALRATGLAVDLRGRVGRAHAGVGVRGARPGSALEREAADTASVVVGTPERLRVQLRWIELR